MLNLSGRDATPPSRTPFALSVALHLAAALAIVYMGQVGARRPLPLFQPAKSSLVYIPIVPIEIPTMTMAELRAPEPVKAEEPAPPRPVEDVAPVFENRRAEVVKPIELPVEPPPAPMPPAPRAPEVTVGTFSTPAAPVRTPEPARQIEIAGFDRVANQKTEVKPATTSLGAFDRQPASDPTKGGPSQQQTAIADAGFNRSAIVTSTAPEGKVVRETGFGNTNSREKPRTTEQTAQVSPVMFDTAPTPQRITRASAPVARRVTPVEVLSKPSPVYTEEARKLRIEGNVVLEVEFGATGTISIVRVVAGLGHGLDEAAVNAAKLIRFKPAEEHGQPVDFRTTVHIVFRLA